MSRLGEPGSEVVFERVAGVVGAKCNSHTGGRVARPPRTTQVGDGVLASKSLSSA
jgi:hypothetical protein